MALAINPHLRFIQSIGPANERFHAAYRALAGKLNSGRLEFVKQEDFDASGRLFGDYNFYYDSAVDNMIGRVRDLIQDDPQRVAEEAAKILKSYDKKLEGTTFDNKNPATWADWKGFVSFYDHATQEIKEIRKGLAKLVKPSQILELDLNTAALPPVTFDNAVAHLVAEDALPEEWRKAITDCYGKLNKLIKTTRFIYGEGRKTEFLTNFYSGAMDIALEVIPDKAENHMKLPDFKRLLDDYAYHTEFSLANGVFRSSLDQFPCFRTIYETYKEIDPEKPVSGFRASDMVADCTRKMRKEIEKANIRTGNNFNLDADVKLLRKELRRHHICALAAEDRLAETMAGYLADLKAPNANHDTLYAFAERELEQHGIVIAARPAAVLPPPKTPPAPTPPPAAPALPPGWGDAIVLCRAELKKIVPADWLGNTQEKFLNTFSADANQVAQKAQDATKKTYYMTLENFRKLLSEYQSYIRMSLRGVKGMKGVELYDKKDMFYSSSAQGITNTVNSAYRFEAFKYTGVFDTVAQRVRNHYTPKIKDLMQKRDIAGDALEAGIGRLKKHYEGECISQLGAEVMLAQALVKYHDALQKKETKSPLYDYTVSVDKKQTAPHVPASKAPALLDNTPEPAPKKNPTNLQIGLGIGAGAMALGAAGTALFPDDSPPEHGKEKERWPFWRVAGVTLCTLLTVVLAVGAVKGGSWQAKTAMSKTLPNNGKTV